jgi:hypothetical protein
VTTYIGEKITDDEANRRGFIDDKKNLSYHFALAVGEVMDAHRKGNKIKFANHAQKEQSNCYTRVMGGLNDMRIGIYASKDIAPGAELLFEYHHDVAGRVPEWFPRGQHNDSDATADGDDEKRGGAKKNASAKSGSQVGRPRGKSKSKSKPNPKSKSKSTVAKSKEKLTLTAEAKCPLEVYNTTTDASATVLKNYNAAVAATESDARVSVCAVHIAFSIHVITVPCVRICCVVLTNPSTIRRR